MNCEEPRICPPNERISPLWHHTGSSCSFLVFCGHLVTQKVCGVAKKRLWGLYSATKEPLWATCSGYQGWSQCHAVIKAWSGKAVGHPPGIWLYTHMRSEQAMWALTWVCLDNTVGISGTWLLTVETHDMQVLQENIIRAQACFPRPLCHERIHWNYSFYVGYKICCKLYIHTIVQKFGICCFISTKYCLKHVCNLFVHQYPTKVHNTATVVTVVYFVKVGCIPEFRWLLPTKNSSGQTLLSRAPAGE